MAQHCSCQGSDNRIARTSVGVLERPRYSPGLILEDSDLTSAVDYTRELNRLLFRSLFGCGVICGLTVGIDYDCGLRVTVAPGLGLDGCGDPLHLTGPVTLELGRREGVLPAQGVQGPPERTKNFWVIACAGEKQCAPRALVCDTDDLDGLRQPTRTRASVDISISFDPPNCGCMCRPLSPMTDEERERFAKHLLEPQDGGDGEEERPPEHDCHQAHREEPGCTPDCGCGSACSCGCCIVLAWVHWFEPEGDITLGGWGVLHNGVRRFVRPALLPDPMRFRDARPGVLGQDSAAMQQAPAAPAEPAAAPGQTLARSTAQRRPTAKSSRTTPTA